MMLFWTVLFLTNYLPLITSINNLELLSNSLRQLHRSGCTELNLNCPRGTNIALVSAKYSEGVLCPGENSDALCRLPSTLQYSVLQTAVEKCQKKRSCKLLPAATSYGTDPCPSLSKHLHVTYTCRPYEFRSKTACENEVVHLTCGPNSRLTVYSASYGRTQYESVQCPQPKGVPEENCMANGTTAVVLDLCHGRRRCDLPADSSTFGVPCSPGSRPYLKVVYVCVALQVLSPLWEEPLGDDEVAEVADLWASEEEVEAALLVSGSDPRAMGMANNSNHIHEGPTTPSTEESPIPSGIVQRDLRLRILPESESFNCTVVLIAKKSVIGFLSEWITAYNFLANNKEKLCLYLAVSIGGGLLCVLLVLIARLSWGRRSGSSGSEALPHYAGELYPGEGEISVTSDASEVVRYPLETHYPHYS